MRTLIPLAALAGGVYLAMRSQDAAPPDERVPRGIRNNNPGNIEKGERWQGLAEDQSQDSRFAVFTDAVYGIRAMARVLNVYGTRDGLDGLGGPGIDTITEIINRWAPDVENNTQAYIDAVANATGLDPETALQDEDYPALIAAMIQHENGLQPYPDSLIRQGIALA